MKRMILLTFLLILMALPACAEIWFPDGHTMHRDPLCVRNDFSSDSCFKNVLHLTYEELETSYYMPCSHCCAYAAPMTDDNAPALVTWYQNLYSGSYFHRDPDCPSVSAKYKPMEAAAELPYDIFPANVCNICGSAGQMEYLFDNIVWNATPEERAKLLPGVWTVPDENALPVEDIVAHAKEAAATISRKTMHSAIALHYDYDDQGNPRKTWRVAVSTTLMQPVCVVMFDAYTGEYLGMRISREYSEMMSLSDPEKLELIVTEGTKVKILANQVNFRNKPKGGDTTDSQVIIRFKKGTTLTLLAEKRCGSKLWYYVASPNHGNGYVDANFAQIIHNDQKRGDSTLSANVLAYCTELRRWQIENGFLALDANGQYAYTRNEALNTNAYREELVSLMQKYSITATVGGTAPFILTNHYGTADLWEIFGSTLDIIPGLRVEDWHSPDFPTEEEHRKLADALAAVDAEYR